MSEYYAIVRSGAEDSLQHYGIVGMRWGIRHDRRVKAAKAMYKTNRKAITRDKSLSKDQKKTKIAASREQWMKERENAANRLYSLNSKETNRRVARMSSGKTYLLANTLGSYGALKYEASRAKGRGRLRAAAAGTIKDIGNNATLGVAGSVEHLRNIRARRKKQR